MRIREVNKEIAECDACPFSDHIINKGKKKELGFGKPGGIMFIGEAPSISSDRSAGHSNFDKFFDEILEKVGLEKNSYYFTNAVKHSIPKDAWLSDLQEIHCLIHLLDEIQAVVPKVVILLGRTARGVFGFCKEPKLQDVYIRISKKEYFIIKMIAIDHPAILRYRPDFTNSYVENLKKIIIKCK